MKKTASKEQQDGSYILTKEEYAKFCEAFYKAQSYARILRAISHPDIMEGENINALDIWTLCGSLSEKFKIIEPLLGK